MRHAGLPTDINWRNQDPVAIGKIAQVVSLKLFHFINYSLLHIVKAISRNKHLKCYKGNWATIKIMKTLLKNWHSYQTHIRLSDIQELSLKDIIRSEDKREDDEWEKMYMNDNGGNKEENGSGVNGDGEEEEEEEEELKGKDNGGGKEEEVEEEEEKEAFEAKERNGKGSSGTGKRKVTQDDQPVAATRSKKRKVGDSKDHQAATQLRKKTAMKSKHSRKCKPL